MPQKMGNKKIPNLKKWKIREKEGKPNVAKHVTGAYFGLLKYAPCLSQVFLYKRLKNTPHWIRTSNLRFRRPVRYRDLTVNQVNSKKRESLTQTQ